MPVTPVAILVGVPSPRLRAQPLCADARYQLRPKAVGCMPWFGAMAYSVRLAGLQAGRIDACHALPGR